MHRLLTIPISHYCEKARWALERARVPYRHEAHLQGLHYLFSLSAGRSRSVPVLVTSDGPVLTGCLIDTRRTSKGFTTCSACRRGARGRSRSW